MKKKLLSLFAGTVLLVPTIGLAVGLGSVRTYSHLNEKLRAEIPVLSVNKKGRMTASLASNTEFSRRGVQRSDTLDDLRFTLVERKGRFYVDVSSKKQIAVPYLNFILRLTTPDGVVSREYAIFLDPASNAPKRKTVVKKKVTNSPYRSQGKKVPYNSDLTSRSSSLSASSAGAGRYGPIRKGETLWSIASHTRPSAAVPVRDMLNAIKRANPKTLSKGLPAGVMIVIPTISGYDAYSGGYAPMPSTVKKNRVKSTKKKVVRKSGKLHVKKNVANSKQVVELSEDYDYLAAKGEGEYPRPSESIDSKIHQEDIGKADIAEDLKNKALMTDDELKEALAQNFSSEVKKKEIKSNSSLDDESQELLVDSQSVDASKDLGATIDDAIGLAEHNIDAASGELGDFVDDVKNTAANTIEKSEDLVAGTTEQVTEAVKKTEETLSNAKEKAQNVSATEIKANEPKHSNTEVKPETSVVADNNDSVSDSVSSDLLDKVVDSAPYIGGGLAAAGLGLFLLNRRRKSKNELAPLTDADMAELMGEDDLDMVKTAEDELDSFTDKTDENLATEALILGDDQNEASENIEAIEEVSDITTLSDDVFSEIDSVVEASEVSEDSLVTAFEDLDDNDTSIEDNVFIDFDEESKESSLTADVVNDDSSETLDFDIDDVFTTSDSDTEVITSALENENKDIGAIDLSSDEGLVVDTTESVDTDEFDFDLDTDQDKALFEPIDLEGTTDAEIELSEEFDFDLTEGDDIDDLLSVDEESLDNHNEEELLFNLTDKDNLVEEISDANGAVAEKVVSTSLNLVDEPEEEKNIEAVKTSLSMTNDEEFSSAAVGTEFNANVDDISDTSKEVGANESVDSRIRMKMDLVNAFISIGEDERAKELLHEIIEGGNDEQVGKAKELLANLG